MKHICLFQFLGFKENIKKNTQNGIATGVSKVIELITAHCLNQIIP